MRGVTPFLILLLAALPALGAPAEPVVAVAITPNDLTVGDRAQVTLSVAVPAAPALAGEPRFPIWGKTWGAAEVLEVGKVEKVAGPQGGAVYRQRLVVAAFAPGKADLPQVAVDVPFADRTVQYQTPPGLALGVRSVLPPREKDPAPKPKPADPPRPLPIGAPFWWTLAALSLAATALGWRLWRRHREAAATRAAEPALAPLPELEKSLDRLAGLAPLPAHVGMSLALRRYLGRVLSFPAVESTTGEVRRQLQTRRLPPAAARQALELLHACDLVKFARQETAPDKAAERLAATRRVAVEVDAHLRPAPLVAVERMEAAS